MLAGYSGNAFHHLETVRLSSTASTVEFSNLVRYSDFQHLQIRIIGKGEGSTSSDRLRLRVNGGTSSLPRHVLTANGSSVTSGFGGLGTDSTVITDRFSNTTNSFTPYIMDILDPFDNSKNTTFRGFTGALVSDSTDVSLQSALFTSLDSISSLAFSQGNTGWNQRAFSVGSRFSLYGLKARA
jgi:hypothetical protein